MKPGKSIDTYENIVRDAWKITWRHKEWWIIGALSGLAYSGAVFNSVLKMLFRIESADKITIDTLEHIFPLLPYFTAYAQNIMYFADWNLRAYMIVSFFFLFCLIIIILASQHLLLSAVAHGAKKQVVASFSELWSRLHHIHLIRLFAVDTLIFLALTLLISVSALILSLLIGQAPQITILSYIGVEAFVLPIAFCLNVIAMIALIHISKHEDSIGVALREGVLFLKNHFIATLEFALILFCLHFIASIFMFVALVAVAMIVGFIFELMITTGSVVLMSLVTFFGFLIAIAGWIAFCGGLTLFQYSAWTLLENKLKRFGHWPALEHLVQVFHCRHE